MRKYLPILILFSAMLLFPSCNNEEDTEGVDLNRPIATKQEGYYKIPTNQKDIDLTFMKMGFKDTTIYQNRWCAFVGDSITILTGVVTDTLKTPPESLICIYIYVNGIERLRCADFAQPDTKAKLINEKPAFLYKNAIIIPMEVGESEALIKIYEEGASYGFGIFFDYMWNEDYDLMVYHRQKGKYFVTNIFQGESAAVEFQPEYVNYIPISWSFGSWNTFGVNSDFEDDGKVEFLFCRVDQKQPYVAYTVHLTREAMMELELNNGKTTRKYWNITNKGTDHKSYEFVVEYPNGHQYKLSFNTYGYGGSTPRGITIDYQGKTYSTTPEFSTLPCRFTTTSRNLVIENDSKRGQFAVVTLREGVEGKELCFNGKGIYDTVYPVEKGFNYLLGRNNSLIFGASNLIYNVNQIPELDYIAIFQYLLIYDGTCPNCITNDLTIDFDEDIAKCDNCQRWYDLNNYGVIIRGDDGQSLIRYPATYNESLHRLEVNNY